MSVQYRAEASQKFTVPGDTGAPTTVTDAVSVTTVPEMTEVTATPWLVTASVVVIGAAAAQA
jgi:hypothetical protein